MTLLCLAVLWTLLHISATLLGASESARAWSCKLDQPPCLSVMIVHNSWHAAFVLRQTDIPLRVIPERADFPAAEFVELSWGDADYFPDPNAGVWAGLRAGLWSRGSVVHLVGINAPPREFYRGANFTELGLTPLAFTKLLGFLADSFARDPSSGRAAAAPGLFSYSKFYPSSGEFSALRTCNTWIAEGLRAAGAPTAARWVVTANHLQRELDHLISAK